MSNLNEHTERWRNHQRPGVPLYHWGPTKPDGTRPHHYGTADPDKCPFCNPPEAPDAA